jgi:transcriptional regulator with XRE-family HTH domain
MMLMTQTKTLGDFILTEMQKRQMSARAFARFVGVDSKTINKFLDYGSKNVGYPSVDFLLKLSQATKADICYLMALVDPSVETNSRVTPDALALSRQIEDLPPHLREAIDALILGAALNKRQDTS